MEQALAELIEKKAIEELRYRYWYAIMDGDVEALVALFTDDILLEYGFGIVLNGQKEAGDFFKSLLGDENLARQVPRGSNGIVELNGDDTASGRWLVEAVTLRKGETVGKLASVQYQETYRKVDGLWKFSSLKNDYLYFENVELQDAPA